MFWILIPYQIYGLQIFLLPNQVHFAQCTASQNPETLGLQKRRGLFTRQPSEEVGEQVLDLPP